ncbi:MAG TPA: hypothetical protein VGZ29_01340 [Terriglobia bacterium]|nr:hypothetical protein [Terriglobia bacterium]
MRVISSKFGLAWWLGFAGVFFLLTAVPSHAQQVKLFLKDGTQLLVKSYQVQGDRIRFYNLDTHEEEEMPVALVDFDATKRAASQQAAERTKVVDEARQLEKEHFGPDTAGPEGSGKPAGFAVAPGLYLPPTEGVYAYDGLRVIPMIQSQGEVVTDKQRAILMMAMPGPLLKRRSLVSLPGPEAAVRIVNPQPVFYIQSNDVWGDKAVLIPVKSSHGVRVVEKVQSGLGVGASGEIRDAVSLQKNPVSKGLFKLQPAKALAPGEYAIGELVDGKLSMDVWDFGIDKPGKRVAAPTSASDQQQEPMGEERPGQTPVQPSDVILGKHPTDSPSGAPLPNPESVPPPITPPNAPNSPRPPAGPPN